MSGRDRAADTEITAALNGALDDMERMKALMRGVIVALDDVRCRVIVRHENPAPGPWDDEHPDNLWGGG